MDISKSSRYKDLVWAIELNRFALEIIGLWPKTNENFKEKFGSALRTGFTFIMIIFVIGIPLICALVQVWGDMMLMVENLQITLPWMVISSKLPIMWWKRKTVSSVVNMIMEDWMELRGSKERNVMIRRAMNARLIVIFEYVMIVLTLVMVTVLPFFGIQFRNLTNLTDGERVLPLPTYYYYNIDKSPLFELIYVAQTITIFLASLTFMSIDGFLGLAIFHMCGQLENFKCGLVNLVSRNIEDIYTLMILAVLICFATTFCLFGFLLLTVIQPNEKIDNISVTRICFLMLAITNLLSQTFLYCVAGELIIQHCEAIYRAICDLEWYTMDSAKIRNLILLMIRTNEPFRITAGKIVPLTMTTFCSLLKTSAGYISFLLTRRG